MSEKQHMANCPTPNGCEAAKCDPCCGCGVSLCWDLPQLPVAERIAAALESIANTLAASAMTGAVFPLSGPPRRAPAPPESAPRCGMQHPTDPRGVCVLSVGHERPHMRPDGLKWGFPVEGITAERCPAAAVLKIGEVPIEVGCTLPEGHDGDHRDQRWPSAEPWK